MKNGIINTVLKEFFLVEINKVQFEFLSLFYFEEPTYLINFLYEDDRVKFKIKRDEKGKWKIYGSTLPSFVFNYALDLYKIVEANERLRSKHNKAFGWGQISGGFLNSCDGFLHRPGKIALS